MLISDRYNFIFIHIYKNAGSSITNALTPYATNNWRVNFHKIMQRAGLGSVPPPPYPPHLHAADLINDMGREKFDRYFSFAFVRNPWDWQVSLYTYTRKTPTHWQHDFIRQMDGFEAYIRWRCAEEVRFQKDFIYSENDELLVDYVGRYERLDDDFREICRRIGISAALPRINVSKEKPYQAYYTPETIELVRRTFAPDIDLFGYNFKLQEEYP